MRRWMQSAGLLALATATVAAAVWLRQEFSPPSLAVGDSVPAFAARTLNGKEHSDRTLAGKPYVLVFLNPHCALCDAALPKLAPTLRRFRGAVLLVVAGSRSRNLLKPSLPRGATIVDGQARLSRAFGVRWYPTVVLVDAEGRVAGRRSGLQGDAFYDSLLPSFLAERKAT